MKKSELLITSLLLLALGACRSETVELPISEGRLILKPLDDNSIRVSVKGPETIELEELYYCSETKRPDFKVVRDGGKTQIRQKCLTTVFDSEDGSLSYYRPDGSLLLREIAGGRKLLSVDIRGHKFASVAQDFALRDDEHLFGLGQFQDGYLDVRGLTRRLTQVNTQVAIPMIISNKGYGLLWNNYGLTDFNPSTATVRLEKAYSEEASSIVVNTTSTHGNIRERRSFETFKGEFTVPEDGVYSLLLDVGQSMARKHYLAVDGEVQTDVNNLWLPPTTSVRMTLCKGMHTVEVRGARGDNPTVGWRLDDGTTRFSSPVAAALDYTVFAGSADEVVGSYRNLTGKAPVIPKWALGYIHCRERYDSQEELLSNAAEFKERGIPVDLIVQDWQWWGDTGWNSMEFDSKKYPDPKAMVDSLHKMDMRLMLSVWSKVDRNSKLGARMDSLGYYIEGSDWIDFFNPDAAAYYWQNFNDKLVSLGIDSWWLDATEPENDDLKGRSIGNDGLPGEVYRNVYPLKVVSTVYNGLKQARPESEPLILTRSSAIGMQRYGAVTWSGDVGNDWETLRRQIVGGLGMMACGQAWWTYDAGGFFRPFDQYDSPDYRERMIRWIQNSVRLPIMRVHGYMSQTEPWRYGDETMKLFVKAIGERYALLPYIEQCARRVAEENYTLMRPLVFDFPDDNTAMLQDTEYMFGPKYLVCPVTAPGLKSMKVYLPENAAGWRLLSDGSTHSGAQTISVPVTADGIPIFERL